MTLQCAISKERQGSERGTAMPRPPRATWLRPEMQASVAELNEQYIDLLAVLAMTSTQSGNHLLVRELRPLLMVLDPGGRRRAAACPYLLMDAGFADPQRWIWARGYYVREMDPAPTEHYLHMPQAAPLARLVFTYAWHLARAHANAARMILGMPGRTAEILGTYTLRQMADLAELHPTWLQPRWPTHVLMWRDLLGSAIKGEGPLLEQARMRGIQLLAAEARSSALR